MVTKHCVTLHSGWLFFIMRLCQRPYLSFSIFPQRVRVSFNFWWGTIHYLPCRWVHLWDEEPQDRRSLGPRMNWWSRITIPFKNCFILAKCSLQSNGSLHSAPSSRWESKTSKSTTFRNAYSHLTSLRYFLLCFPKWSSCDELKKKLLAIVV